MENMRMASPRRRELIGIVYVLMASIQPLIMNVKTLTMKQLTNAKALVLLTYLVMMLKDAVYAYGINKKEMKFPTGN